MPNKLHFYTKYSKEKIKISDKAFASGGEGAIYAIASPRNYSHLVAKIYYPEKRTKDREAKMHYLMQHPPIVFQKGQPPSIGWVQDVVYKDNQFLGILLIKIEGKKLTKLTLAKLSRRADKAWQRFAFQDPDSIKLRLRTCFNLAVVIYQIHEYGQYVLVDLKPDNVLMQPNGLLAVVDMDSVEVIENGKAIFAAPVATPEYTPPEHYTGPRGVIEETWDRFSLGVIFYQLLLGLHPFAASSHPPYDNLVSIHDKIQHHLYVHNSHKKEFLNVIPPPHKRHDQLPIEVQQLFQACFVLGAENPFSRPSALDWCVALAALLNLPFKGMPKYKLPFQHLPKIDFKPSDLYFSPNLFILDLDLNLHYKSSSIDFINLKQIDKSMIGSIKAVSPSIVPQTEQKKLWDAMETSYKDYLNIHRNNLFLAVVLLIPCIILGVLFPWSLIFGSILLFAIFPQLIIRKSKDIVHSIGGVILPTSTDDISSKHHALLASNNQHKSTIQTLETKKEALTKDLNQLSLQVKEKALQHFKKVALNKVRLSEIQQNIKSQHPLIDSIELFNPWVQELNVQLKEIRIEELNAYADLHAIFSEQFATQLQEKKTLIKDTFRDFNNKIFKLEKALSLQQSELLIIEDEDLKKQLLADYNDALETNSFDYALELEAYQITNQEPFPAEIQILKAQEVLQKILITKRYHNKREQTKTLKRAKRQLGKNFQVHRKKYLDLLYESGVATELHFAHHRVRDQFKLFQEQIANLDLEEAFQQKLSNLLTPEESSEWTISPQISYADLPELESHQLVMSKEWTFIEEELEQLQKKIASQPINDIQLRSEWLEEIRSSIIAIKTSQDTYHKHQDVFYTDSKIALIYKELKKYRTIIKAKQNLEVNFLEETALLNENSYVIEERLRLNLELERYQKNLKLEEDKKAAQITLMYEQKVTDLQKIWNSEIQHTEKEIQKKSKALAQLEIEFQSFQDNIETTILDAQLDYQKELEKTRLKYDTIYKDYQATCNEKLDLTTKEYDLLEKSQLTLASQIKTHHAQHLKNKAYSSLYRNDLAKLRAIETEIKTINTEITELKQSIEDTAEEKIKIETLIKWQENYSTKIYIKDLLLNKVEQFSTDEDKKV